MFIEVSLRQSTAQLVKRTLESTSAIGPDA